MNAAGIPLGHGLMAWFSLKVEVTFIDDATGEPFGVTQIPPDDLPESFELDTTLHIGDDDWSVVDAQPSTRAEYAKSGLSSCGFAALKISTPARYSIACRPSVISPDSLPDRRPDQRPSHRLGQSAERDVPGPRRQASRRPASPSSDHDLDTRNSRSVGASTSSRTN